MEDVTMKLADSISQINYGQISSKAATKAKECLLDSLGCAFFGSTTEWGKIVNEFVQSQEGVREASLWTTNFQGPAANVVLGNGTMIHSFDFDDYHMTKIHPGAPVIPAAVAIGEKEHIDGRTLIAAIVAGYETMIHISRGINPSASRTKGWHLTGTCGTFAAAAAVGKIWQFDTETMASALGMAGTQSAGLWAFTADGSYSKRFHPGRAAQSGIIAASLAKLGYRGPTKILEAEDGGFCNATSYDLDLSKVTEGFGEKFDMEDVVIKPYPACGSLHSSIDAALIIREQNDIDVGKIRKINVYNSEVVNLQCGFDYRPMGALQAQMSMKYCVACAVLEGLLTTAHFTEKKISDPVVVDLAGRVYFVLDEEINKIYPREFPSIVEIVMQKGEKYKVSVNAPKGSVEKPMSWQEIQDKFKTLALPVIDEKKAEGIIKLVEDFENVKDVAEITELIG
ncbi:MAG: MmgE/PrpD family protein [Desulfobacteraceae bacterium]|nr:MmgE/PrpD family protein [Desulfobacteraceae bacterium]